MEHPSDTIVQNFCKYFHGHGQAHATLKEGDHGPAVMNITRALHALELPVRWTDEFTSHVHDAVKEFQKKDKHQNVDGMIGPGTRTKLVKAVLFRPQLGAAFFSKLDPAWDNEFYSVFLSYAWEDGAIVEDIHACLKHNGVMVLRDVTDFLASGELKDEIRRNIEAADKALTVVTDTSLDRYWVRYEEQIAATIKNWKPQPFTMYLKLTTRDMPKYLPTHIYIDGRGKSLQHIGFELKAAIYHQRRSMPELPYDPNKVLVP